MDVCVPLKRRMKIKKDGGDWIWISFKNERLPIFCCICGKLGHSERLCASLFDLNSLPLQRPYGIWLRDAGRCSSQAIRDYWLREEALVAVTANQDTITVPKNNCPGRGLHGHLIGMEPTSTFGVNHDMGLAVDLISTSNPTHVTLPIYLMGL